MSTRLDSDTTLLLHHPMLEGILLSECARLKQFPVQRALLVMLQRLTSREIRTQNCLTVLARFDVRG